MNHTIHIPSRVPESLLQKISLAQPVDFIVQEILQGGFITPLELYIPMSACLTQTSHNSHGTIELNGIGYQLQENRGTGKISLVTIRESGLLSGTIEFNSPSSSSKIIKLGRDTVSQIQAIMRKGRDMSKTGKIRIMPISKNTKNGEKETLRYSDEDGNLYFLYAPRILNGVITPNQSELHKYILGLYREEEGILRHYRVINSMEETSGRKNKIHLHLMEADIFDLHIFSGLYMKDLDSDPHIEKMIRETRVITLSRERFYDISQHKESNKQTLKL